LVKSLQTFLNKNYNAGLTVDGIFGPLTLAAVKVAFGTNTITEEVFNKNIGDY
jgi:peptidoglycan hydrolase-like protein with peptidoglycan-binding domain